MILVFLCILGDCAFAFLFTASDVWVVDISRENTDTLDTVLAQSSQQGVVLFLQSEYSGNKTEIKYLSVS